MGFTAITIASSMYAPSLANEIIAAANERMTVLGQSAVAPVVSGGNAQDFRIRLDPASPAAICTYFVQSHDLDGTPRAANYYDGKSAIDMWTWENLCKAAGCWVSGSRYGLPCIGGAALPGDLTDPADSAFTLRTFLAGGDAVHPSVYYWLQRLYKLLIWTRPPVTGTDGESYKGDGLSIMLTAWATLQGWAETGYAAGDTYGMLGATAFKLENNTPFPNRREARLKRSRAKFSAAMSDSFAKDVYWYAKVSAFGTFDNYGDSEWVAGDSGVFRKFDSEDDVPGNHVSAFTSSTTASTKPNAWPADPPAPPVYNPPTQGYAGSGTGRGYTLSTPIAVAEWTGFTYK